MFSVLVIACIVGLCLGFQWFFVCLLCWFVFVLIVGVFCFSLCWVSVVFGFRVGMLGVSLRFVVSCYVLICEAFYACTVDLGACMMLFCDVFVDFVLLLFSCLYFGVIGYLYYSFLGFFALLLGVAIGFCWIVSFVSVCCFALLSWSWVFFCCGVLFGLFMFVLCWFACLRICLRVCLV